MSTAVVYYPHAIYAPGIFTISQLSELTPAHNYQDLTEFSASQVGPQFTGTHMAAPDCRFSSTQIKSILDACVGGDYNLVRDLSEANVDIEYKAGDNRGLRLADNANSHLRARMAENAMLCWESITARQGQAAEIRCRLAAIYKPVSGVDPLILTASNPLSGVSDVAHVFTLGPVKINGSFISAAEEATFENNVEYDEVTSDGDGFLTYLGVRRYRPQLRFSTRDTAFFATYGTRGTAVTSFSFWLRKKLLSGINVADATQEHILISATAGTAKARQITNPNAPVEITVDLRQSSQNTACYEIDTTAAIA